MRRTRWTIHALRAMEDRHIQISEVEKALIAPEMVAIDPPLRAVFMRRYLASDLGREMLLRVVVEETSTERVIITVYRTSQIDKYLKG
ncbi:MAG: DUF4258 domain-containing protein [Thermomicrobiales bacterium]